MIPWFSCVFYEFSEHYLSRDGVQQSYVKIRVDLGIKTLVEIQVTLNARIISLGVRKELFERVVVNAILFTAQTRCLIIYDRP